MNEQLVIHDDGSFTITHDGKRLRIFTQGAKCKECGSIIVEHRCKEVSDDEKATR